MLVDEQRSKNDEAVIAQPIDRQDKIILLLEYLARSQPYGVDLFYPNGERLGAKGSIEMCAEGVEFLTRRD